MISLVLKDFKIIKNIIIFGTVYALILAFAGTKSTNVLTINQIFSMFYTLFMTYFSIVSANSYDEKNKANFFIRSLPVPKEEIVIAKYLGIVGYTVYYYMAFNVSVLIVNVVLSANSIVYDYKIFTMSLIINLFIFGIQYPFYFKYGAKFIQIFRIVGFVLIFIIPNAINKLIKSVNKEEIFKYINWINQNQQVFIIMLTLIVAIEIMITIMVSIKIYSNKDLTV